MNSETYEQECVPFVVRGDILHTWPCLKWSFHDWATKCAHIKLTFRVHPKDQCDQVQWENEAVSYVDATVGDFIEHVFPQQESRKVKPGPFDQFPLSEFSLYSGYNYMHELFDSQHELFRAIRWRNTGLGKYTITTFNTNQSVALSTYWQLFLCNN